MEFLLTFSNRRVGGKSTYIYEINMDTVNYKNFTDKELKYQGNKQFAARNFDGAIDSYTLAIMKNSNVPHYYTNRALCYLNQKRWPQAVQDARQALEKDPNLVKGHFYLRKTKRTKLEVRV